MNIWEVLKTKIGFWGALCAAIVSTVAVIKIVWAATDYIEIRPIIKREFVVEQTAKKADLDKLYKIAGDISTSVLRLQFNELQQQVQDGKPLTFDDQQKYCGNAQQLGLIVSGCSGVTAAPVPPPQWPPQPNG